MSTVTERIGEVVQEAWKISQTQKELEPSQEVIDNFLDRINKLKEYLTDVTTKIDTLYPKLASLTWIEKVTEDELVALKKLLNSCKEIHSVLIKRYAILNKKHLKSGIAREEIKKLKNSLDDFKEACEDVKSRFFILPQLQNFKDAQQLLDSM